MCGYRLEGLNLWDATGIPFQLDTSSTNYHHDGLDLLDVGVLRIVFYSEHNAPGVFVRLSSTIKPWPDHRQPRQPRIDRRKGPSIGWRSTG